MSHDVSFLYFNDTRVSDTYSLSLQYNETLNLLHYNHVEIRYPTTSTVHYIPSLQSHYIVTLDSIHTTIKEILATIRHFLIKLCHKLSVCTKQHKLTHSQHTPHSLTLGDVRVGTQIGANWPQMGQTI